jgi:hypothetical protein
MLMIDISPQQVGGLGGWEKSNSDSVEQEQQEFPQCSLSDSYLTPVQNQVAT